MPADLWPVLYSCGYGAALLAVGEGLNRAGVPAFVTRRLIHLGAGLWIVPAVLLFQDRHWALVPPLLATGANWLFFRRRLFRAMDPAEPGWGTVLFPAALALGVLLLWHRPAALTAGFVALAAGDPAAALVGRRWGWGRYGPAGGKSLAGSLSMFAASLAAIWAVRVGLHGEPPARALAPATVLAAVAALLEAAGQRGLDNLLVPLGVALAASLPLPFPALAAGVWLSLLIGIAAYRRGALAESGVLGAVITGTLVFGLGGWVPGVTLVAFFVSSSLLSRVGWRRKAEAEARYAKGARRDLGQALANGGVAAALCAAAWAAEHLMGAGALAGDAVPGGSAPGQGTGFGLTVAALGALAAACADTWATEVGALSSAPPRLITTLRPVPAGTSGAVSGLGLAAAAAGAGWIALVAAGVAAAGVGAGALPGRVVAAVALGGLIGSGVDSLMGATLQGVWRCRVCGLEMEQGRHCGQPAVPVRGWPWLGNDLVNLAATAAGAAAAYLLAGG